MSYERLRATFNEDAVLYDRARPGYPTRLFEGRVARRRAHSQPIP